MKGEEGRGVRGGAGREGGLPTTGDQVACGRASPPAEKGGRTLQARTPAPQICEDRFPVWTEKGVLPGGASGISGCAEMYIVFF